MMVLPESIWGIEIKRDADTYARLERQIKDYNRFFDYNIVVVGATHGNSIMEHVPEYWGIITVEDIAESPIIADSKVDIIRRDTFDDAIDMIRMDIPDGDVESYGSSEPQLDFYILRKPQRNPKREKKVLFRNQMSFLWKSELSHIQEINGMRKLTSLSKKNRVIRIMDMVPEEELKRQLCDTLIERDYYQFDDESGVVN